MIDWSRIDTVLLDMDGTLLDLHFDSHFWLEHLPRRYAEREGLSTEQAKARLYPMLRDKEGTIDWYCLDYWTEQLGLDVALLKHEVQHLIDIHPRVLPFLERVRASGRRLALVTNAHQRSLELKMQRTRLADHFDDVVCAHDFGMPKEQPGFWERLRARVPFAPERTLLVDDSERVLHSAHDYGIAWLLAVRRPDSHAAPRPAGAFPALDSFADIMPEAAPRSGGPSAESAGGST